MSESIPNVKVFPKVQRVGVIDDDVIFTSIAGHKMKQLFPNAEVFMTNDPEEQMAWLADLEILFLDINLVTTTAWEFMELYAASLKDVQLILCSSSIDIHDLNAAKEHPLVDGYVIKPISNANLLLALGGVWPNPAA